MPDQPAVQEILSRLRAMADPRVVRAMARFAVPSNNALGIPTPKLRNLAGEIGKNHRLAVGLWRTGIHEARILAPMIDDPRQVTEAQMERWVKQIDAWDVCDGCCGNLFDKTPIAFRKAREWSRRREEFVKRAGFALMAELAVHDKQANDATFLRFLPAVRRESTDERNFVKKGVNWALRQIGKRNRRLNRAAIGIGKRIRSLDSRSARWIAADALRELTGAAVQKRLRVKAGS